MHLFYLSSSNPYIVNYDFRKKRILVPLYSLNLQPVNIKVESPPKAGIINKKLANELLF